MEFLKAWLWQPEVELRRDPPAEMSSFPGMIVTRSRFGADEDILGCFLQGPQADVVDLDRHRCAKG